MKEEIHEPVTGDFASSVVPSEASCPKSRCGCAGSSRSDAMTERSYVYALGRIHARIPSLGIEKELAQLTGRTETAGLTDRETLSKVLSSRANRYLARRVCWVFAIEGIDTYILKPEDDAGLEQLIASLRAAPRPTDIDVVVGRRGGLSSPSMCNGLIVPIVLTDQVYSFDVDELVAGLPTCTQQQGGTSEAVATEEVFFRLAQMAGNAGADDDHRALNYLTVRYPNMYALAAQHFERGCALTGIEVRPSRLSSARKVVEVIFAFASRVTDFTSKYACRVDVTEEFPFLMSKLSPFYDIT